MTRVAVLWAKTLEGCTTTGLQRSLRGRCFAAFERRAKYLLARLEGGGVLVIHLRMSGNIRVTRQAPAERHDRIWIDFDNGLRLHFRDPRKFGRWRLCVDTEWLETKLGPEPLSEAFTGAGLYAALQRHRRMLKPLLLDQSFVAGLGNIYVDEALFSAGLHPGRRSDSVTRTEAGRLRNAIRRELRRSIRNQGTSLGGGVSNYAFSEGRRGRHGLYLRVYQRTGEACVKCGHPVQRRVVGQRATHYCPECQPESPNPAQGKDSFDEG
jgi:formamidopyrimidine-DNA glycosylase